jgi:hypothetical protein
MLNSKVYVYFNLHTRSWSIRSREAPNYGLVIAHAPHVVLKDCTFRVGEKLRQRVIATGKKNVHAGVAGTLISFDNCQTVPSSPYAGIVSVSYNPFKSAHFIDRATNAAIYGADGVALYSNPTCKNILAHGAR